MTDIHLSEKFLAEHPELAEKIRQAEAAQYPPVQPAVISPVEDAPGRPESDDQNQGGMIHPWRPKVPPKMPRVRYLAVAAGTFLAIIAGGIVLAHGPGNQALRQASQTQAQANTVLARVGQTSALVAQMQGDLNRVMGTALKQDGNFGGTTLSALQAYEQTHYLPQTKDLDSATWYSLQTVANKAIQQPTAPAPAQPSRMTQTAQSLTSPVESQPPQEPAPVVHQPQTTSVMSPSTAGGETVSQWWASIHRGPGTSGPIATIPLPSGDMRWNMGSGNAGFYEFFDEAAAIGKLPVSAFYNNRAPVIGQISGSNDLAVTLEISGPNGTKVLRGKLDSGAEKTMIPTSDLAAVGLTPTGSQSVIGATGSASEGIYRVPTILVRGDSGQWEDLANAATVWGSQFNEVLVGADILKQYSLSVSGNSFVLGF